MPVIHISYLSLLRMHRPPTSYPFSSLDYKVVLYQLAVQGKLTIATFTYIHTSILSQSSSIIFPSSPSAIRLYLSRNVHERPGGYVIGTGVHLYCMYYNNVTSKRFEWHFSGWLTLSNTHGRLLIKIMV